MPKGYVLVLLDVLDGSEYAAYARAATAIEAEYGGRPLVAGDAVDVREGEWPTERVVVLEFPSIAMARSWYDDPRYRELMTQRHRATESHVLFIEGFAPPTEGVP